MYQLAGIGQLGYVSEFFNWTYIHLSDETEHGSHPKWPFRGKIAIHFLNQAEDDKHIRFEANYIDDTPDKSYA